MVLTHGFPHVRTERSERENNKAVSALSEETFGAGFIVLLGEMLVLNFAELSRTVSLGMGLALEGQICYEVLQDLWTSKEVRQRMPGETEHHFPP